MTEIYASRDLSGNAKINKEFRRKTDLKKSTKSSGVGHEKEFSEGALTWASKEVSLTLWRLLFSIDPRDAFF